MSFLDVTISREVGGGISTDVFSKPTDTHQYLDYRSRHPKHVRQAIPYGQALRLRRICSSESKFDQRIEEFKGYLHKRGFQKTQILSQCEKVRNKDRRLLFQDKERFVDNNAVPLVLNILPIWPANGSIYVLPILIQNLCILYQNRLKFFTHLCATGLLGIN